MEKNALAYIRTLNPNPTNGKKGVRLIVCSGQVHTNAKEGVLNAFGMTKADYSDTFVRDKEGKIIYEEKNVPKQVSKNEKILELLKNYKERSVIIFVENNKKIRNEFYSFVGGNEDKSRSVRDQLREGRKGVYVYAVHLNFFKELLERRKQQLTSEYELAVRAVKIFDANTEMKEAFSRNERIRAENIQGIGDVIKELQELQREAKAVDESEIETKAR